MKDLLYAGIVIISALVSNAWGDLTGLWSCNDGGTYYLRQTGRRIHWYGEATDADPVWSNVFSGHIDGDRIKGTWVDVPKGRAAGSGDLELLIAKDANELRAVNQTGGVNGSRWRRMAADTSVTRSLTPLKPSGNEDCVTFNPAAASVRQVEGRWMIVAGDHWLFDFGSDQAAAIRSLQVIRHYRMDRSCSVGRPDPSFAYMLAKGGSPSGAMTAEDCVAFDPKTVTLSKIQGSWKIVSGRHWLFDFNRSQTEAQQALAVIRRQGFTHACFVGRPGADFTYLRR